MAQPRMYGNIEIFCGTGSEELARKIGEYLAVPLSPREIVTFPNENIFVRLQTSVRGKTCSSSRPHPRRSTITSWSCSCCWIR